MPGIGPVNSNLRLLPLARTWRRNDFADSSAHSGTWLSRNSRCIQKNQFHYSCDLAMRGIAISFSTLARVVSARSFLRFLCRMHLS